MHRAFFIFGIVATTTFTLIGCRDHNPAPIEAPTVRSDLPEPPPRSRGGAPSDEDVLAVRAVVAELVKRAEANDEVYFRGLMPAAGAADEADMVRRVKGVDMNATYPKHLVVNDASSGRLDYHNPSHFQVDLARAAGQGWRVARLWFCR